MQLTLHASIKHYGRIVCKLQTFRSHTYSMITGTQQFPDYHAYISQNLQTVQPEASEAILQGERANKIKNKEKE